MKMRWMGHVEYLRGKEKNMRVYVVICEDKRLFEDLGLKGSMICKWILKKMNGRACKFMFHKMWRIYD